MSNKIDQEREQEAANRSSNTIVMREEIRELRVAYVVGVELTVEVALGDDTNLAGEAGGRLNLWR